MIDLQKPKQYSDVKINIFPKIPDSGLRVVFFDRRGKILDITPTGVQIPRETHRYMVVRFNF